MNTWSNLKTKEKEKVEIIWDSKLRYYKLKLYIIFSIFLIFFWWYIFVIYMQIKQFNFIQRENIFISS